MWFIIMKNNHKIKLICNENEIDEDIDEDEF